MNGSKHDEHTRYVAEAVERRCVRVLFIETARVPESASLFWECGTVHSQGESLDGSARST